MICVKRKTFLIPFKMGERIRTIVLLTNAFTLPDSGENSRWSSC